MPKPVSGLKLGSNAGSSLALVIFGRGL